MTHDTKLRIIIINQNMICCWKQKEAVGFKEGRETNHSFPENDLAIPLLNEIIFNPVGDPFYICIKFHFSGKQ